MQYEPLLRLMVALSLLGATVLVAIVTGGV